MKSRITIEVDFEHGNQPVIQIIGKNSITEPDVRDSLVQTFLQNFQGNSYAKINFKLTDRDSGELSFHARAIITPIKSEDLGIEWQKMQEQDQFNKGIVLRPVEEDDMKIFSRNELIENATKAILDFIDERVDDSTITKAIGKKLADRFANL